jgi:hypothetical protein
MESISPPGIRGSYARLVPGKWHKSRRPAKAIGAALTHSHFAPLVFSGSTQYF